MICHKTCNELVDLTEKINFYAVEVCGQLMDQLFDVWEAHQGHTHAHIAGDSFVEYKTELSHHKHYNQSSGVLRQDHTCLHGPTQDRSGFH